MRELVKTTAGSSYHTPFNFIAPTETHVGDEIHNNGLAEQIIESTPDHISVIGDDYRYRRVNHAYEVAHGITREEIVGLSVAELLGIDCFEALIKQKLDQCLSGESVHYNAWFDFKVAGRRYMDVHYVPLPNEHKNINAILVISRDQTELETLNMELEQRIAERTEQLNFVNKKLLLLSNTDGLTGLSNRRHFDDALKSEYIRLHRSAEPLSLIMLDVDFFKNFNDAHGHVAGDDCLREIAALIRRMIKRPPDLCARYGGEEFAILLPETDIYGATSIAEQIRIAITKLAIPHAASTTASYVTVSLGVATVNVSSIKSEEELIKQADDQLYKAKLCRRNCVASATCSPDSCRHHN